MLWMYADCAHAGQVPPPQRSPVFSICDFLVALGIETMEVPAVKSRYDCDMLRNGCDAHRQLSCRRWCFFGPVAPGVGCCVVSIYRVGVAAVFGLFVRSSHPGAVTFLVADSALMLLSTRSNRRVDSPARAFWRRPCTDRSCSPRTVKCVRHSSMRRRSPSPWRHSGRTVGTVCQSWRAASTLRPIALVTLGGIMTRSQASTRTSDGPVPPPFALR